MRLLIALTLVALVSVAGTREATASGTASISGNSLVYAGDGTTEHVEINKERTTDENGDPVGAMYSVQDTRSGGVAKGTSPCGPHVNFDAFCPFPSSDLQVTLGAGADTFRSLDQTLGKPFSCLAVQAFAPLRLDAGAGMDLVDATRLADTIAGGSGGDGINGYDGDDRVTGGSGVDLIQTHDGNDVADGGTGDDVIHLDALGRQGESCFGHTRRAGNDTGRGSLGNDAITGGPGHDRIEGGPGNDELVAGDGRDKVFGGPGRDRIAVRDGERDYVDCGPGRDVVEVSDAKDRVVRCETRVLGPR